MATMNIDLDSSIRDRLSQFQFAWALFDNVAVLPASDVLKREFANEEKRIKEVLTLEELPEHPGIQTSRRAFKKLGLDPARYRPSQEALGRRILSDKPISFVNNAVDVNNLLSIRYMVPLGLYDADKIEGNPFLKVGTSDDVYFALNTREINCEDKLILCDIKGPFGSPFVDSMRTAVNKTTCRLLHVAYFLYDATRQNELAEMAKTFLYFLGGTTTGYILLP